MSAAGGAAWMHSSGELDAIFAVRAAAVEAHMSQGCAHRGALCAGAAHTMSIRPRPQRLHHLGPGASARGCAGPRPRASRRREAGPSVRPAHPGQRQRQYPRLPDDRRHAGAAPFPARRRCARGRRSAASRRHGARQDQPARAVLWMDQQQSGVRRGAQSLRSRRAFPAAAAAARRRDRRASRAARHRGRYGRIHPRACGILRHRRFSPDHRPLLHPRLRTDLAALRSGRTACAQRGRSRAVRFGGGQ